MANETALSPFRDGWALDLVGLLLAGTLAWFTYQLARIERQRQKANLSIPSARFEPPKDTLIRFDLINRGFHPTGVAGAAVQFVLQDGRTLVRNQVQVRRINAATEEPSDSLNVAAGERASFIAIFQGVAFENVHSVGLTIEPAVGKAARANLEGSPKKGFVWNESLDFLVTPGDLRATEK